MVAKIHHSLLWETIFRGTGKNSDHHWVTLIAQMSILQLVCSTSWVNWNKILLKLKLLDIRMEEKNNLLYTIN